MHTTPGVRWLLLALLWPLLALEAAADVVVVEPAAEAGPPAGTRLESWELLDDDGSASERGELRHPLDLELAFVAAAPRGPFVLVGAESVRFELPRSGIEIYVRPALPPGQVATYDRAMETWKEDAETASSELLALAVDLAEQRPEDAAWLTLQVLRKAHDAGLSGVVESAYESATEYLAGRPRLRAHLLRERASRVDLEQAVVLIDEALELDGRSDIQDAFQALLVAKDLDVLGRAASGDAERSADAFRRQVELFRTWAPGIERHWAALFNGSLQLFELGRLEEAERWIREAHELGSSDLRGTVPMEYTWLGLARVNWQRGELALAQERFDEALRVIEEVNPDSPQKSSILINLALVAHDRGDLERSEQLSRQALAIELEVDDRSLTVANILNNLAMVANERGEWDEADSLYAEALDIYEEVSPDSISVARALNNRANNARRAGRLDEAVSLLRRSQEISARKAPESRTHSTGKEVLGLVLEEQGELKASQAVFEEAAAGLGALAPGGLRVARPRFFLGRVLRKLKQPAAALAAQREALEVVGAVAPGSALEAQILNETGRLHREGGDLARAEEYLCRAAASLDEQKLRLGGNRKAGNPFDRELAHVHRECLETRVALGRAEAAFEVLERSRARDLLMLLAERDLALDRGLPETLRTRRDAMHREYDEVFGRLLSEGEALDDESRSRLEEELEQLRRRRDQLERELRAAAPRLAEIDAPTPHDADAARAGLDPGTLLLAYSLGETSSHVFALRHGSPRVAAYDIAAGRKQIAAQVNDLRRLIATDEARAVAAARALWDLLLAPASKELATAGRLLVSPDGPLHLLPFAALLDEDSRFLVEHRPIHMVASSTLYAELRRRAEGRPADDARSGIVAFADPVLPADLAARPWLRSPSGGGLGPLPGARKEALALSDLYGERVSTYLGAAASEERLKREAGDVSMLHLATHGYLDPRSALDSGLVLAESGDHNGLLQAWEIFEDLPLRADLVTLSACETALGEDLAGEGIIGLTRAFHFAGARSVLASLWKVPDESTARLMASFYGHLRDGLAKDEALRAAQLEILRGSNRTTGDTERGVGGLVPASEAVAEPQRERRPSEPRSFAWAAFQLFGDRLGSGAGGR